MNIYNCATPRQLPPMLWYESRKLEMQSIAVPAILLCIAPACDWGVIEYTYNHEKHIIP